MRVFHSKFLKDFAPNVLFDYYSAWLIDVDRFTLQPVRLIASLATEAANRRPLKRYCLNINHPEHCIKSCIKSYIKSYIKSSHSRMKQTIWRGNRPRTSIQIASFYFLFIISFTNYSTYS